MQSEESHGGASFPQSSAQSQYPKTEVSKPLEFEALRSSRLLHGQRKKPENAC